MQLAVTILFNTLWIKSLAYILSCLSQRSGCLCRVLDTTTLWHGDFFSAKVKTLNTLSEKQRYRPLLFRSRLLVLKGVMSGYSDEYCDRTELVQGFERLESLFVEKLWFSHRLWDGGVRVQG